MTPILLVAIYRTLLAIQEPKIIIVLTYSRVVLEGDYHQRARRFKSCAFEYRKYNLASGMSHVLS